MKRETTTPGTLTAPTIRWTQLLLVGLSVLAVCYAYLEYRAATRNCAQAQQDLAESRGLGQKISQLTDERPVASLNLDTSQELTRQITNSIQEAQIPSAALVSILPEEALRLDQSDYRTRRTQVQLRDIPLGLLASFQDALNARNGLYLEDLVLTPAERAIASNGTELWDARLTLTQLIYSPTSR